MTEDDEAGNTPPEAALVPEVNTTAYKTELYEGRNCLVITKEGKYPITMKFGLGKARLILDSIEQIKAFVAHEEQLKANAPKGNFRKTSFKPKG